ncbi:MAG: flagellar biosynthetic protein FliO [Devosia sp.]
MQFMAALFGGPENTYLNAGFALGIVLVMIVLGVWVLKLFTRAGTTVTRGRNRRLAIVDQVQVDPKRQLLIIRRDNVEHLILTGGPQDLLVESGIAAPEPQPVRRPAPRPAPARAAMSEVETPIHPDLPVSRDAIDRLRDLARPAPLRAAPPLRRTGLLRPVSVQPPGVIPMGPALRVDNSAEPTVDSAKTGTANGSGGGTRLGGATNRFFRSIARSDQS